MNEKVEEFLNKKATEKEQQYIQKRDKILIENGLFEREYSDEKSDDYEFETQDPTTGKIQYYKKVAIEVTDEEYVKILEYCDELKPKNNIANILKIFAVAIFFIGALLGIIIGGKSESGPVILYIWLATFVSGMMYLGFAEIIQLLNDINNKK